MNERKLNALFRRALLGALPVSLTSVMIACGGISVREETERTTTNGTGGGGSTGGGSPGHPSAGTAGGINCSGDATPCGQVKTVSIPSSCVADHATPPTDEECSTICAFRVGAGLCGIVGETGGTISVKCSSGCSVGRRPMGWLESLETPLHLGCHFAIAARLEALSVIAFRQLRAEVTRHGAPRRIRAALGRAARDEVRHARSTAALARRFGGVIAGDGRPVPRRDFSLEAIAIENVAEGCVREISTCEPPCTASHGTRLATRPRAGSSTAGSTGDSMLVRETASAKPCERLWSSCSRK